MLSLIYSCSSALLAKTALSTNGSIVAFLNGIPIDLSHLVVSESHFKFEGWCDDFQFLD